MDPQTGTTMEPMGIDFSIRLYVLFKVRKGPCRHEARDSTAPEFLRRHLQPYRVPSPLQKGRPTLLRRPFHRQKVTDAEGFRV